uniref:RING-type E3 ubiquitin transferase n=1 Tax=Chromera velia CCMP2878 TaxID=1169474 RepID=A0A0G4GJV3_9ALVE|eukprot:Cvel_4806.t1-p1 / transcript=Cvel_4806.t1 / gene=Cvel_4806 / organism=Chromera_velia_CCMP2878 / gene_product=E3 ubiquitin-protein ligase RING2, putative / transcript_product=E3 ubiquitin-protein ligase RING2, putative / location=Cvel_scaffold215:51416-57559(+) / protein_length=628 / sequence_SO=supercontig / SO=protein_coding / is_pseudo=false
MQTRTRAREGRVQAENAKTASLCPLLSAEGNRLTLKEVMELQIPPSMDLYDYFRRPRKIGDSESAQNPKGTETGKAPEGAEGPLVDLDSFLTLEGGTLDKELVCPICLGYLKQTVTIKACLHRFCAECIEKCLRSGGRECPQCRFRIGSRRECRPDPIYDGMVRRLFPDVEEFERQQEQKAQSVMMNLSQQQQQQNRMGMGTVPMGGGASSEQTPSKKRVVGNEEGHPTPFSVTPSAMVPSARSGGNEGRRMSERLSSQTQTRGGGSVGGGGERELTPNGSFAMGGVRRAPPPGAAGTAPFRLVLAADPDPLALSLSGLEGGESLEILDPQEVESAGRLRVRHLCRFAARRLGLPLPLLTSPPEEEPIALRAERGGEDLPDAMGLSEVHARSGVPPSAAMTVFYRVRAPVEKEKDKEEEGEKEKEDETMGAKDSPEETAKNVPPEGTMAEAEGADEGGVGTAPKGERLAAEGGQPQPETALQQADSAKDSPGVSAEGEEREPDSVPHSQPAESHCTNPNPPAVSVSLQAETAAADPFPTAPFSSPQDVPQASSSSSAEAFVGAAPAQAEPFSEAPPPQQTVLPSPVVPMETDAAAPTVSPFQQGSQAEEAIGAAFSPIRIPPAPSQEE